MTTEGADVRPPLRVHFYGTSMASVDDGTVAISATGPDALRSLASQLFAAGWNADQVLELYRGGELIGQTTINNAAHGCVEP